MRRKPPVRHPSVALALRRHPRWRTAAAVALGLASGGVVAATVQSSQTAREAWGTATPVLVATEDLEAGDLLDAGNTRVEPRPRPVVPAGALSAAPDARRLHQPVYSGEVIVGARLAPAGRSPVAARLPEGARAVAIPVEPGTTPPLVVGDLVEILVALPGEATGGGPPGFALTSGVPVVDIGERAVTVAVGRDVAPRLAVAFGQGAVTLALVAD